MSRIKSELNAAEIRQFFDPTQTFASDCPTAFALLQQLRVEDFHIKEIKVHQYHTGIRLGCGLMLLVYLKGTVMVQGRPREDGGDEAVQMLREMLPTNTVWQVTMGKSR